MANSVAGPTASPVSVGCATSQMPIDVLAIVVPCHNEEQSVSLFLEVTDTIVQECVRDGLVAQAIYVFIDDGSFDRTVTVLRDVCSRRPDVHYCSFSRNFGKEAALLCGMRRALELRATHVVVMDADLQDPPSLLPSMIRRLDDDRLDVVAAFRQTRAGEPAIRSWFAKRFYALENRICDVEMRDGARDFRIMTDRVVREICALPERERFSKGLFQWVGFRSGWIGYENVERAVGQTSWSFTSLVRYAFDGIISFSSVPLELISVTGIVLSILSLIGLLVVFIRALCFGDRVSGWPSLVCIVLFLGGLQLSALGVIGLYLTKVLSEVKGRPSYIVAEQDCGMDDEPTS